jgi:hypothetical protein
MEVEMKQCKKIGIGKAKSMLCPVCERKMAWIMCSDPRLPSRAGDPDTTQFFRCDNKKCNVRIMISDLIVDGKGVIREWERHYSKQRRHFEKEERKRNEIRKHAGLDPIKPLAEKSQVTMDPVCEKCGNVYCDHENKY